MQYLCYELFEDLTKRLSRAENDNAEMTRASQNMDSETANFKAKIGNFEKSVKGLEKSNKERETQIAALTVSTCCYYVVYPSLAKLLVMTYSYYVHMYFRLKHLPTLTTWTS